MNYRLNVGSVTRNVGVSKKPPYAPYDMTTLGCFLVVPDEKNPGKYINKICELTLPKDHPEISPGMYEAVFSLTTDQAKKVVARLVSVNPLLAELKPLAK